MSTTDPTVPTASAPTSVILPPGVTLQPGRQTTQSTAFGQVVQGVLYPVVLANGTVSSIFVPDSALGNIPQLQALFDAKINGLNAIPVG